MLLERHTLKSALIHLTREQNQRIKFFKNFFFILYYFIFISLTCSVHHVWRVLCTALCVQLEVVLLYE